MSTPAPIVIPLASPEASTDLVGGKGQSLATLAVAGLPIPAGFLLSTTAYNSFIATHELKETILEIVTTVGDNAAGGEQASVRIRSLIEAATLPPDMVTAILQAYAGLGADGQAVAVRSSATAEDLPDASFAGQQDTCLNVRGEAALLDAIRNCWASLWTARAITYRERRNIDHGTVAMGVVVQLMVPADVSGVLFTANPTTGERSEFVVNASFGLGEAVVSGEVTPDTYLLDRTTFEVKQSVLGAKETIVTAADEQGTVTSEMPAEQRSTLSLSAETLGQLAALSVSAEGIFASQPQDIEWAVAADRCWLLQSRPITNLPPPPLRDVRWEPPEEGKTLIRRQVVENMPEPLSPLFAELYLTDGLDQAMNAFMTNLGVPVQIEEFVERPFFLTVNGFAYCRGSYEFSWRLLGAIPKILVWYVRALPGLLRTLSARWRDEGLPTYLATIDRWRTLDTTATTDEQLLAGVRELAMADAVYWFDVSIAVGAAKITDGMLHMFLSSRAVKGNLTSGMFLRGFASKTLAAQADLEALAQRIRADESTRRLVVATPAQDLQQTLQSHAANASLLDGIAQYLDQYGHQIYNLDFAQPTQGEDPRPIFQSLKALIEHPPEATATRQAAMALGRQQLVEQTLNGFGPVRRWLFRKLLGWAQTFGPLREEALFYMGAAWPTLRRLVLEIGARLTEAGTLKNADDVFFLEAAEIQHACAAGNEGRSCPDLKRSAQARRELREARRQLHPPPTVPENRRWKVGPFNLTAWETQKRNPADAATLAGFAVSPGQVTGTACVILSPEDFAQMQADAILVCPTTTPAWTPLFAHASALVTDVGGILAHGSIVAREYGIPAVLGTGNATRRIVSGQRITVDGTAGTVTLIE
jgi:pyruvate,water dikinase